MPGRSVGLQGEHEKKKLKNKHRLDGSNVRVAQDHAQVTYDEEARKKEREITSIAAAAVLAEIGSEQIDAKKRKKMLVEDGINEALIHSAVLDANTAMSSTKKRKHKEHREYETEERDGEKEKHKKKTKSKESGKNDVAPDAELLLQEPAIKRKKEKKRNDAKSGACEPSEVGEVNNGKEKKKHERHDGEVTSDEHLGKKQHELPILDPSNDSSLPDQARKALEYAYLQYTSPSEWKFNKARQNWLIRNVWLSKMIPDDHFPLVAWYLKSVKGGVKDTLINACHLNLKGTSESQVTSESGDKKQEATEGETSTGGLFGLSPESLAKPSNTQEIKQERARIILHGLAS
ncbi:hypothetical protein AMATHDRAFT_46186 [Amanita thiersii Skay4041]|uniref:WKF domain-containing protein n=1 Tax=Amanita thiersii Skay4041 TaxID=703135 RepID=A0A2A9NXV8_9AGAR|nr:hypothetical protein AMATHDRAFT_46186 [Amanita thiersii Skay4041]